jgi:hypothetical protein
MSLSKLKRIHVIIIGVVVMAIAGAAVFLLQVRPQIDAYKAAQARYEKAVVKGNEQAREQAIRERDQAIAGFQVAQALLDVQMKRRMPSLNFSRRDIGMLALWKEQIKTLGPLLEGFAHDPKVTVTQAAFKIEAPPANPNDPKFDADVLAYPLGSVVVSGNFQQVMANIRRWNNCPRLIMVGPPRLAGVSPRLVASYDVTCYIFPVAKGGAMIQMAGAAAGAAGATGVPGALAVPGTAPPTPPPSVPTP